MLLSRVGQRVRLTKAASVILRPTIRRVESNVFVALRNLAAYLLSGDSANAPSEPAEQLTAHKIALKLEREDSGLTRPLDLH